MKNIEEKILMADEEIKILIRFVLIGYVQKDYMVRFSRLFLVIRSIVSGMVDSKFDFVGFNRNRNIMSVQLFECELFILF